jgi:hypothetical protein
MHFQIKETCQCIPSRLRMQPNFPDHGLFYSTLSEVESVTISCPSDTRQREKFGHE